MRGKRGLFTVFYSYGRCSTSCLDFGCESFFCNLFGGFLVPVNVEGCQCLGGMYMEAGSSERAWMDGLDC